MNSIFKKVLIIISIPVFVVMALVVIHDTVTPGNKAHLATPQPLTPEQEKEMAIAVEGAAKAARMAAKYAEIEDTCRQVAANGIKDDTCILVNQLGAEKAIYMITGGNLKY